MMAAVSAHENPLILPCVCKGTQVTWHVARRIQEIERAIAKVIVGAWKGTDLDPGVCLKGKFPVLAMVNDGKTNGERGSFG